MSDDEALPFPELAGMRRVARVVIPIPTHDQHAQALFAKGLISRACRVTPCQPCEGFARECRCVCCCHSEHAPFALDPFARSTSPELRALLERRALDAMESALQEAARVELARRAQES